MRDDDLDRRHPEREVQDIIDIVAEDGPSILSAAPASVQRQASSLAASIRESRRWDVICAALAGTAGRVSDEPEWVLVNRAFRIADDALLQWDVAQSQALDGA